MSVLSILKSDAVGSRAPTSPQDKGDHGLWAALLPLAVLSAVGMVEEKRLRVSARGNQENRTIRHAMGELR